MRERGRYRAAVLSATRCRHPPAPQLWVWERRIPPLRPAAAYVPSSATGLLRKLEQDAIRLRGRIGRARDLPADHEITGAVAHGLCGRARALLIAFVRPG